MIDDDTDEHEIFNMAIEDLKETIDCLYFTDCESAVAHFSRAGAEAPSHVFIDLKLPRLNGEQCLAKLQQIVSSMTRSLSYTLHRSLMI
ncbi:hypothetical protein SAMN04487996_13821 [Dyadobacter soli]|uniref:Response regulator receiver domain-containing protein n=2 Tax=Dyadobacter soli TaxID=659014 RepID=A0A1G8CK80_9BACT|nr:hypothetical protein SAMN04487996_13821 [Dyadobacter soli]